MNNNLYGLYGSVEQSINGLWAGTMLFLPTIILAILVLILGWIVGGILGRIVRRAFKKLRLDEALDKAGVDELSEQAGVKFKPSEFVGALVKWFIILAFAMAAFDILGLAQVNQFMNSVVLTYLPQVFAAVLILFAAVVVSGLAANSLTVALRAGGTKNPELFGKTVRYLVIIFGFMAALNQLQIAEEMIQTLFMGIVFALALALGLAFGLGGKDAAAKIIEHVGKKD